MKMKIDYLINNQDKKSLGCFVKKKKKKMKGNKWLHDPSSPGWNTWFHFAGISAVLLIIHKLYLAITCKKFHLVKARFLFCTAGIPLCHVIASTRLSRMKKLINISLWKNPYEHILIDRSNVFIEFYRFVNIFKPMRICGVCKQIPGGNLPRLDGMKIDFRR